ncbi:MAG: UDP-N-acetylmuramoyl-L-alanine--D-glutamate ligase [Halobacteriovoraceae bacterium]|nr:UDP-N-acetylmuramoyl-L-alanine--D-glutamate ligase [Halobacteriovoraceae bacterium]
MGVEQYKGKNVLIVGLGKTGFALINFFNGLECKIKVTDIKPIFDLNKPVKRLKKIRPMPEMTLGEHREDDFISADLIVYSTSVNPKLPQLELARQRGVEVHSEFSFAYKYCNKPVIAVGGSLGRTTIAHMIAFILKTDKKNVFVGGGRDNPFINFLMSPDKDSIDYAVVEVSPRQLQTVHNFHPAVAVIPNLEEKFDPSRFASTGDYIETSLDFIKNMNRENYLVINFDRLSSNYLLRNTNTQTYWYSKRSFVTMGVIGEVEGTHFHGRRIHSNIHYHSEFRVNAMRILGNINRENLLAAITAAKALNASDEAIQQCIKKFPGIPHRLEFVVEKNGVKFYNDSKAESIRDLVKSLQSMKTPVILIAGGKEAEQDFEPFMDVFRDKVRLMVLVGECKESMNRMLGDATQTFLVGSFDESVLIAYQKSRTGDTVLFSPGNPSTDFFRDYEEKGNYFKKMVFQL